MTNLTLEEAKKSVGNILDRVIEQREQILISEQGKALVVISPVLPDFTDPFARHPEIMGVKINCDLTETASELDWPEECR